MVLLSSCTMNKKENQIIAWKKEIVQVEKEFCNMATTEGIPKAFEAFADDDAVLMRNRDLVIGKKAIVELYNSAPASNAQLVWEPEFVEVAESGDLAYTYGYYTYSSVDSSGNTNTSQGVFHTVWKRQKDGNWKYVWD